MQFPSLKRATPFRTAVDVEGPGGHPGSTQIVHLLPRPTRKPVESVVKKEETTVTTAARGPSAPPMSGENISLLADRIYGIIVDRVKRERAMGG